MKEALSRFRKEHHFFGILEFDKTNTVMKSTARMILKRNEDKLIEMMHGKIFSLIDKKSYKRLASRPMARSYVSSQLDTLYGKELLRMCMWMCIGNDVFGMIRNGSLALHQN
ncbi:hypothetical protein CEXT_681511 [Caerostris extrusa]|uniref:Uncharacterized protein n=1 Tax=Caerostris extrusa TaxID=172846 RepID=A0AAV4QK93_CAEEX|nr:hypothetical protein CEXT_681511 [Caerostris extrusa]